MKEEKIKQAMAALLEGACEYRDVTGKEPPMKFIGVQVEVGVGPAGEDMYGTMELDLMNVPKPVSEHLIEMKTTQRPVDFAMLVCGAWEHVARSEEEVDRLMEQYGTVRAVPGRVDIVFVSLKDGASGRTYMARRRVGAGGKMEKEVQWSGFGEGVGIKVGHDRFLDKVVFRKTTEGA